MVSSCMPGEIVPVIIEFGVHGNFLLLRPYHGEHGPKVPVTPEYLSIVFQQDLRKRECMYGQS
jgi:hypothetical protein